MVMAIQGAPAFVQRRWRGLIELCGDARYSGWRQLGERPEPTDVLEYFSCVSNANIEVPHRETVGAHCLSSEVSANQCSRSPSVKGSGNCG
jgi:hypothetical protein